MKDIFSGLFGYISSWSPPDGPSIASGIGDGSIKLWDMDIMESTRELLEDNVGGIYPVLIS